MDGQIRILHVDDEPEVTDLTATYLEREDDRFSVETARSAEGALDRLAEGEYECIVSDYEMKQMNGIEFLDAIRSDYPDLPFILFTGKGSEEVASEAISKGVTDYLQKASGPSQYKILANRIDNAVSQYTAEQRATTTARELASKRELLDSLFDTLPVGVLAEDASGDVLAVNEQYLDLWEIPASREEVRDWTTDRVFDAVSGLVSDPENFYARTKQLVEADRPVTDREIELADGRTLARSHRTFDLPDGRGYLWIYRDITERKERERELEGLHRRTDQILDVAEMLLWEVDPDDASLSLRGPVDRVFGVPAERLSSVEDLLDDVVHPDDRSLVRTQFDQFRAGVVGFDDVTFRTDVGIEGARWVWVTGQHTESTRSGDQRIVGVARDMTDFEQLDRATGGESWYQALAEYSTDITAVIDSEGVIQYKNPAMGYHLGYEPHEVVGENAIEYVHPEDRQRVETAITPVMEGDAHRSETYEYRYRHADGSWLWFESVLTDCTETALGGYLVNSRDITERKARERELQRQNDRLDQFSSVVSHDLRSPLNVAEGRLELAREECDSDHLEAVGSSLDRMAALIEDLLTLAREGQAVESTEPVALDELVRVCWDGVSATDATIVTDTDQTIRASRSQLRQLLENLLRNAVEHGGEDVTVTVGALDDQAGFYVADDGPGIPEAQRESVFEPGYSTSDDGTGFGLQIVQQIAGGHRWEVDVSESDAGGARFEVTGVSVVDSSS